MYRLSLTALLSAAILIVPASAAASRHRAKPATFKAGTYSAKTPASPEVQKFNITLKKSTCAAAPGQGTSPLHLCVSLVGSPLLTCTAPLHEENPLASFLTAVALPASGKLIEHAPATGPAPALGGEPESGEAIFSVTFTKKGAATGYLEQNLTYTFGNQSGLMCNSGKLAFTAKVA